LFVAFAVRQLADDASATAGRCVGSRGDRIVPEAPRTAGRGYDADELIARRSQRGRPALGASRSRAESVRLDPKLRRQLLERAESERDDLPDDT
jgi:hypothetical protein